MRALTKATAKFPLGELGPLQEKTKLRPRTLGETPDPRNQPRTAAKRPTQVAGKPTPGQPGPTRKRRRPNHELELWKKHPTLGISLARQPGDPHRSQEKPRLLPVRELRKKHPTLGISLARQQGDPHRSKEKPRQVSQGQNKRDAGRTTNSGRSNRTQQAQSNELHHRITSRERDGTGQKQTRHEVNGSEETAEKHPEPGARVRSGRKGKNLGTGGHSRTKRSNQLEAEEPIPGSEVTCRRRIYEKRSCRIGKKDATHARKEQEKKRWPQEANPSGDWRDI